MVLQDRYLLLIAALHVLFTFVNTNGEYILGSLVAEMAREVEAQGALGGLSRGEWIGRFTATNYVVF